MLRKFFVLALVALVPLMIGCGSDDGDSDVAPVTNTATTLTPSVTLPASLVGASTRGLVNPADVVLTIGSTPLYPTNWTTDTTVTPNTVTLTFQTYTVASTTFSSSTSGNLTGSLDLGDNQKISLTIPVSNVVSTAGLTAANTAAITITTNATTGAITVTVSTTPAYGSAVSGSGDATNASTTVIASKTFYVASVKYGTTTLTSASDTAITVATLTPSFVVTLSEDFAATDTYSFTTKNLTDNVTLTWTNTNNGGLIISTGTKTITFGVASQTSPKLENGKLYSVTFTTTLQNAAKTQSISNITRFFKVSL